jgi:hypothetical protein
MDTEILIASSEKGELIPNYWTILKAVWSILWRGALCMYLFSHFVVVAIILGSIEGVSLLPSYLDIIYETLHFLVMGEPYAYAKMLVSSYLLLIFSIFLSIWQLNRLTYRQRSDTVAFKISAKSTIACLVPISMFYIGMGYFRVYALSSIQYPLLEIVFLCIPSLIIFSYFMRHSCRGIGIFMRKIN